MQLIETTNVKEYIDAGGAIHSPENQRIADKLVDREVMACASYLVSHLCELEPHSEDVIALNYPEPDYAEAVAQADDGDADWPWLADYLDVPFDRVFEKAHDLEDDDEGPDADEVNNKAARAAIVEAIESGEVDAEDVCREGNIDVDDFRGEIFEHWIVTDCFGDKLRQHGETVVDFCGLTIWGRQTTGQSISLDLVVASIAAEMQALHGQRNDWSVRD